jgi:pyrroloquinoline-quinone synthase
LVFFHPLITVIQLEGIFMDTCELFLNDLDNQIQSKHLLNHDFYQAWSKGMLSIECLQEYAKDYYQHVKAFPTYLSAIHCRTDNMSTRQVLLQNLIEEEAGSPNHPELWKNFVLALGVTEEELANHKPSIEMEELISTFRNICGNQSIAEGISALYAYESQIPEISLSKIEGLKKHYGMQNPKDWNYFAVHIAADKEHAAQERQLLKSYLDEGNHDVINYSVNKILDVLQHFLTGMCTRYQIAC